MSFTKTCIFELNLKYNVPPNVWYTDSNNELTMVAHGHHVDRLRHIARIELQTMAGNQGVQRLFVYTPHFADKVLLFSDNINLQCRDHSRGFGYVVGNMQEFGVFCQNFIVEKHALPLPPVDFLGQYGGIDLGDIQNPDDFAKVIAFALEVGRVSCKH